MKNFKIEIKWGIIFAVMTLVWMFLEKTAGLLDEHIDKHFIYINFINIPAILIYFLALNDKRKNFYSGVMTYKQGFVTGVILTLIVVVLSPLTHVIVSRVITPEYFPNAINYVVNQKQMTQAEADEYFNLRSYIVQGLFGAFIMGLITTAIVAIFTTRKPKLAGS